MYLKNALPYGRTDNYRLYQNPHYMNYDFSHDNIFGVYNKIDDVWLNKYYDFTPIIIRLNEYYCMRKEYEEIKEEQLRKYEYKARIVPNVAFYNIYKIPRTFVVAYADSIRGCALISALMRANLHYLYLLIGCVDVICYIGEYMYEMVKYDYSLYICAN